MMLTKAIGIGGWLLLVVAAGFALFGVWAGLAITVALMVCSAIGVYYIDMRRTDPSTHPMMAFIAIGTCMLHVTGLFNQRGS